jgi:hypothetical protein
MNKTKQNSTLTARQGKTITAVLVAKSIAEGLKKAKVSRSSYYQWMRENAAFKDELERQRKELIDEGYHLLRISVLEAATTILELQRTAQGEGVRLRAAESIIDRVYKLAELEDIEERLEALERRIER